MTNPGLLEPVVGLRPSAEADSARYEIVHDQRVEKPPMSVYAGRIAFLIAKKLDDFGEAHRLGRAGTETLFRLDPETNLQRRPDADFVSYERWSAERPLPHSDPWEVVPEVAVEVISKTNPAEDVIIKVEEYFRAGVQLVWVV